jgi:hypothetical protein
MAIPSTVNDREFQKFKEATSLANQVGVIVLSADGGSLAPYWDRSPVPIIQSYDTTGVAPHGLANRSSYTVPTGKRSIIDAVSVGLEQDAAASAAGFARASVVYQEIGDTRYLVQAVTYEVAVGTRDHWHLSQCGLMLAGEVVRIRSIDGKTGGTMAYHAHFKLLEFTP